MTILVTGGAGFIGANCEKTNLEVVHTICRLLEEEAEISETACRERITFVKDRPGHDYRYAMDTSKIERDLGWQPAETFETGLRKTVRWYLDNEEWVDAVRSGEYRNWITANYDSRASGE